MVGAGPAGPQSENYPLRALSHRRTMPWVRGISNRDYRELLDLAVTVLSEQPGEPPWTLLTASAQKLLNGRLGAIGEFDLGDAANQRVIGWTDDRSRPLSGSGTRVRSAIREHGLAYPPVRAVAAGRRAAFRISDLVSESTWRRSETYRVADTGFDHCVRQLVIPLSAAPDRVRMLIVARSDGDFSDRELALGRRAQPLLRQVERQTSALQRLLRERRCSCGQPAPAEPPVRLAAEAGLTPREWAVLGLLATGMTARAIGRRLGITPSTVSKHQERLYRKLGTRDRTTTVVLAQRLRLITTAAGPDGRD
jgi:DNA-binding CsgD family transcriptional regulator